MPRQIGWWHRLTQTQRDELDQMVRDATLTYTEIGRVYGQTPSDVGYYATSQLGLPPRNKKRARADGTATPSSAASIEAALLDAQRQEEELRARIAELRRRRAELAMRFEDDGDDVLVHGVGPAPLRAAAADWLRWLQMEGARKLRDYLAARAARP